MSYTLTGLMSGTSLDGIDIACCTFSLSDERWTCVTRATATLPYPPLWRQQLQQAYRMSGRELMKLHMDYGFYLGEKIRGFHLHHQIKDSLAAVSHGHTIFHQPHESVSFQLGHGAAIASTAQCDVVSDLRSMDVALGGQGAPLVPLGDKLLFGEYGHCLNLGGFANMSCEMGGKRIAFDICPLNYVSNQVVREAKIISDSTPAAAGSSDCPAYLEYDPSGRLGRGGRLDKGLLNRLNGLAYYRASPPKSLGREWVDEHVWPLFDEYRLSREDRLRTWYEHAAIQLAGALGSALAKKVLVTGGGVHNVFLMERIEKHLPAGAELVIPERGVVDFKEAIVFAFLGLRCLLGENNCLASVTGARRDAIGGSIHRY